MKIHGVSSAAAVLLVLSLKATTTRVRADPIESCAQQSECLKFEVYKVPGTLCSGLGSCPVRVCMKFDLNAPGCDKQTMTVSHACDNADANGCVRAKPWLFGPNTDKGLSVDLDASGTCINNASNTRCPNIPDEYRMCQDGKPGDTLYFTVKDGGADLEGTEGAGSFNQTVGTSSFCSPGTDVELDIYCTNAPAVGKCCNPNCNGNGEQERSWSVKVPDLCNCGPTPAPANTPTQAPVTAWCPTNCVYTGEEQCGRFVCDEAKDCCKRYYDDGDPCEKTPPPEAAGNDCFLGNVCDGGICKYSFKPADDDCTLTQAQLNAAGYTQPGCHPTTKCEAVVGGTPGATQCVIVPGTDFTKVTSFTLVDSVAPNTTYELDTFSTSYTLDYRDTSRCYYNIRVNTQDCGPTKVDSVYIEWDLGVNRKNTIPGNTELKYCEDYTPYSVFGDGFRGTPKDLGPYSPLFNDGTLFLGTHTLKATAYTGPNCTGTPSDPLSATVLVTADGSTACPGTVANLEIYNKVTNKVTGSLVDYDVGGATATYCFPPSYTIRACSAPCADGEIKWVRFDLYREEENAPFFSYNDTSVSNRNIFVWDEEKPSPLLTDGNYVLIVTPYGNKVNYSFSPPKYISSYGPGTPYPVRFTIDCTP